MDNYIKNVKWYGALGNGENDDTEAIQKAIDSNNMVYFPEGVYLHKSPLVITDRTVFLGEGVGNDPESSATVILKGSETQGDGVIIEGFGTVIEKICFAGQSGNTGDGIVIKVGRVALKDVAVYDMGNDGVRVGTDTGGENCNLWYIENLKSKRNGNNGLTLSEGSGGAGDANGGTLIHADLQINGNHGLEVGNAQLNTLVGVVVQSNGADGVHLSTDSNYNAFHGGDYEANTGQDINIVSGAVENKFFGPVLGPGQKFTDNGTRTIVLGLSDGTPLISKMDSLIIGIPKILSGSGVPTANEPDGSLYLRTDGGNLYVRENNNWILK